MTDEDLVLIPKAQLNAIIAFLGTDADRYNAELDRFGVALRDFGAAQEAFGLAVQRMLPEVSRFSCALRLLAANWARSGHE